MTPKVNRTKATVTVKRNQYLPEIGFSDNFQNTAFALTSENPLADTVVEISNGACLLHLKSRTPIDEEKYKTESPAVAERLLAEKKNATFNNFVARLRASANLQSRLSNDNADKAQAVPLY